MECCLADIAMVLYGISNIYKVSLNGTILDCVIKGKVLKTTEKSYAPLAPGDEVEIDISSSGFSQIVSRMERRSEFCRWNKKGKAPQTLAANADLVVCVSSPVSPPFRPRFIDRVHVTCEIEKIPLLVVMNKNDQVCSADIDTRLAAYTAMDCEVLRCSALTGEGVGALADSIAGRRVVICGQSGVGKTSLLNLLLPDVKKPVGEVSSKHNRGRHTTRHGMLFINPRGGWIVDTPGIREFEIVEIEPADLSFFFPEMVSFRTQCAIPGCSHDHEPGCAVYEAVGKGIIHVDRYESYLRLLDSLISREDLYGQS